MTRKRDDKLMLTEQFFEVRYTPSGSFLDVRGFVADYIRASDFLPHWKIGPNIVIFRDGAEKVEREGAFAGYKHAGYVVYDPETRNFFVDRANSFWKTLQENEHYTIPSLTRFGARTKVFLPSDKTFDEINNNVFQALYTDKAREVLGGTETDVQFVVDLKEDDFDVRVSGGPIHPNEVGQHFSFKSDKVEKAGFFLDLDYYRAEQLKHQDIRRLLHKAVGLTWEKVERLATTIGV